MSYAKPFAAVGALGFAVAAFYASQPTPVALPTTNRAFVFVKPHACYDNVNNLVKNGLAAQGITIQSEGEITSETIDSKKLIDQHYYSIASKATILTPDQLNVDPAKFKKQFGKEWTQVLADGKAYNAMDACKLLGVDANGLNKLWAAAKKSDKLVKLGGGFYCGELPAKDGSKIYVFNGFFMTMRNEYCAAGRKIHYYTVEFDPAKLSWSDFRSKVLGPTDPADAPAGALRGEILKDWKNLGLTAAPNVGDNGVHASASPFEAMAERMNWLGVACKDDDFCTGLLSKGLPEKVIREWSTDPQVKINAEGKKGSLFDALEDMNVADCLAKTVSLYEFNKAA